MFRALFGPIFATQQPCARAHGHSLRPRNDPQFLAMREVQREGTQAGKALFYSPEAAAMLPFAGIWVQTLGGHYAERSPNSYDSVICQYNVETYGEVLGLSRLHCNCAVDGKLVRDATYVRWVQDEMKKWYAVCHIQDSIEGAGFAQVGCGMRVPLVYYINPGRGQMNTAAAPPQDAWRIDNTHPSFAVTRTRSHTEAAIAGNPGGASKPQRRATILSSPTAPSPSSSSAASCESMLALGLPASDRISRKRKHDEIEEEGNGSESEDTQDDAHEAAVRKRRHIMSLFRRGMDETSGLTSVEKAELEYLIETEHCALCDMYFLREEFRKHVLTH
ncbi:hypothetical protein AURDEDRAFT_110739 [Auricularia subglabra TFB-10046 SS5]|nr:hypothetical protein AURDEDRAFT_110739 [Auricularia subglabra TFB-10046 SS5]